MDSSEQIPERDHSNNLTTSAKLTPNVHFYSKFHKTNIDDFVSNANVQDKFHRSIYLEATDEEVKLRNSITLIMMTKFDLNVVDFLYSLFRGVLKKRKNVIYICLFF